MASARASAARNCSPFESTWNGRTHDGGEENPTDDKSSVTSLIESSAGKPSSSARSAGQSKPTVYASPNISRATVLLPQPEGPTIKPTFHGFSSSGRLTCQVSALFAAGGTSNIPSSCITRGERMMCDCLAMVRFMRPTRGT